jgi:hypothetical protein
MQTSTEKHTGLGEMGPLDNESLLRLSEQMIINRGRERVCYQHPQNTGFVIKIPLDTGGKKNRTNQDEWKGYQLLRKEKRDLSFISHCHGFVDTDHGQGLVCDCVRDDDGAVSKTIWDIVIFDDDCDVDYITEITRKLCDYLLSGRIWLFDLNPKNIALKRLADGTLRPYVIDLKGRYVSNELIPLSRYITYFSRKKLRRRSLQLLRRIADLRERREEMQLLKW